MNMNENACKNSRFFLYKKKQKKKNKEKYLSEWNMNIFDCFFTHIFNFHIYFQFFFSIKIEFNILYTIRSTFTYHPKNINNHHHHHMICHDVLVYIHDSFHSCIVDNNQNLLNTKLVAIDFLLNILDFPDVMLSNFLVMFCI